MAEDEDATVRILAAHRQVMIALIDEYGGRVVHAPGDNVLAVFGSVLDAVRCAVEIQEELNVKNAELPENRKMEFRIGINLGDVIEEGETIHGNGVNIAARMEGLAEGGGICLTGTVYDSVKNKLSLGYKYLGEQTFKNIIEPVRVYRVLMEPEAAGKVIGEERPRRWRWTAMGAIVALILVAGALTIWSFYLRPAPSPGEVTIEDTPGLDLPDKPSLAVLPFANVSGDPKEEYFSDGITEQIITALSRVPHLFVIAHNSTLTYKGKTMMVQKVGRELGVRYVLNGSTQKSGDRVRITAQLIDTQTGHHLWADRYDRNLEDIFALQDEITMKVITALQVKLTEREQTHVYRKGTNNLEAYLNLLKAGEQINRFNIEGNTLARQISEKVIELDPEYAAAYAFLGATYVMDVWYGSSQNPKQSLARAFELVQKAIARDKYLAPAHGILSFIFTTARQHEKAIAAGERAIALDPNSAPAYAYLAFALRFSGRPEEAIALFKKAIRLNPFPPNWYYQQLGATHFMTGQYEDAITVCKKALQYKPDNLFTHIALATTYALCGQEEEARAEAAEVLRINPKFSLERYAKTLPYKNQADVEFQIGALRKAGLK
jgi:TolB-like protein/Flp pilus assembly protein TadD